MPQVEIEVVDATLKGGYVPWLKEKYPFSKLTNAEWTNDEKTALRGPSFLIAKEDNPPTVLAAGRKRLKHCNFVSRKANERGDIRVWLHPDSPLPADRPTPAAKKTDEAPARRVKATSAPAAPATAPSA
mgnify:CR=1 FL=1